MRTEVVKGSHLEPSRPRVDAHGECVETRVVADEGGESVAVNEELQVDAATEAQARGVDGAVDVPAHSASQAGTVCRRTGCNNSQCNIIKTLSLAYHESWTKNRM